MTDTVDPEKRSSIMRAVRGKDTAPELRVRKWLHRRGFRFRLHDEKLPGRPDIVLPRRKVAIFVHGCFWHRHEGCRKAAMPKSRREYWAEKFAANVERDALRTEELNAMCWRVAVIWECALSDEATFEKWMNELAAWMENPSKGMFFETGLVKPIA